MKIKNLVLSATMGTILSVSTLGVNTAQAQATQLVSSQSMYKYCKTATVINKKVYSDIYYMYSDNKGSYFLNPFVKTENVIFVPYKRLKTWNINIDKAKAGDTFTGIFPDDNYKLIKVKEITHG